MSSFLFDFSQSAGLAKGAQGLSWRMEAADAGFYAGEADARLPGDLKATLRLSCTSKPLRIHEPLAF